jgi:hypothetical protein
MNPANFKSASCLSILKMHIKVWGSFHVKKNQFERAGILPRLGFAISQNTFLQAFYNISYRIAKQKKPHITREILVKPCALEMIELICGLEQERKL